MSLHASVDANIRGFAHKRSRTWPYVVERLSRSVWVVADKPRARERTREYFVVHGNAAADVQLVRKHAAGKRFVLCVAHPAIGRDRDVEAMFKSLSFRLRGSEGLFVRTLPPWPRRTDRFDIRRVNTVDAARLLAKAARSRQLTEDEAVTDDADLRVHMALIDGLPVGWCGSARTAPTTATAIDVYVDRNHRRRGIGLTLMRALLIDDAKRGITQNHLSASRAGALLYNNVGYDHIGTLTVFDS